MTVKLWRLKANSTPDKQQPALRISILSAQVKCECLLSQVSHCITDFTRLRINMFIWVWGKEGNVRWPWSIIHQTNKGRIHFKKAVSCLTFSIFPPCGPCLVHKIENTMLHIQYSTCECAQITFAFWKQLYIYIKHQALLPQKIKEGLTPQDVTLMCKFIPPHSPWLNLNCFSISSFPS